MREARLGDLAQRAVREEERDREEEQRPAVRGLPEQARARRSDGGDERRGAEDLVGPAQDGRAHLKPRRAGRDGLAEAPHEPARLRLRAVSHPEVGMPDRLVGGLEKLLASPRGALRRPPIAGANPAQESPEGAQDERGDQGHASGEDEEKRSNRRELRYGPRTAEKALLKSGLHLPHPVGQRDHGLRCATDIGAVIVVSWSVQAVNSQEGVEEFEPEVAAYLSRHSRLNESRVSAGGALDEDDAETHQRQKKRRSAVVVSLPSARREESIGGRSGTEPIGQRKCEGAGDECHERMADGMQRGREKKAQEPRGAAQYPP